MALAGPGLQREVLKTDVSLYVQTCPTAWLLPLCFGGKRGGFLLPAEKKPLQANPPQGDSARGVATLPGLGRLRSHKQMTARNVEPSIKIDRIMQGGGSGGGDGRIRSDQKNHQKPSGMPAYI